MDTRPNTLFLRLEGHFQSWGTHEGKFKLKRTASAPTKSGVAGLLCCALGIPRDDAQDYWLPVINSLRMGVRIDRAGMRWWDFHTVGADQNMRTAELKEPQDEQDVGELRAQRTSPSNLKEKSGPILTRREYLSDASFLVALQGDTDVIAKLSLAIQKPKWCLFLGRKSCPPSRAIHEHTPGYHDTIFDALCSVPLIFDEFHECPPQELNCLVDWIPAFDGETIPSNVSIHYDVPASFQPPYHKPRFVQELAISCPDDITNRKSGNWRPGAPRADYGNTEYRKVRAKRLVMDNMLCVICKSPATTVQHVDYSRAGGKETTDDLRALCRLCHDACTMLEYGSGMTTYRIDPCLTEWREKILSIRKEIVEFRSQEVRSRKLNSKEED